ERGRRDGPERGVATHAVVVDAVVGDLDRAGMDRGVPVVAVAPAEETAVAVAIQIAEPAEQGGEGGAPAAPAPRAPGRSAGAPRPGRRRGEREGQGDQSGAARPAREARNPARESPAAGRRRWVERGGQERDPERAERQEREDGPGPDHRAGG